MKADFQSNLQSRLEDPSLAADPSLEDMWDHLKFSIAMASEEVLGFASKKNKDWFDENNQEIQELLVKKRSIDCLLYFHISYLQNNLGGPVPPPTPLKARAIVLDLMAHYF